MSTIQNHCSHILANQIASIGNKESIPDDAQNLSLTGKSALIRKKTESMVGHLWAFRTLFLRNRPQSIERTVANLLSTNQTGLLPCS